MIKNMEDSQQDAVFTVADMMVAAAKTAPKGSGADRIVCAVISKKDKDAVADMTRELGVKFNSQMFIRDAGNLDASPCAVIIGATATPLGLDNCGNCGFKNCAAMKKAGANCAFNITDLGIAVGSAVSLAADHRIDNRVMYTIGKATAMMDLLPKPVCVCYGIPLSISQKNIFFDRNPGAVLV